MSTALHKYEGLGNDFLIADLRDGDSTPSVQDPGLVRTLCDRNFGMGADGVLAVLPPSTEGALATMRVLNADGSVAEMCGNGIRCVVKYLADREPSQQALTIDTGAGPLHCDFERKGGAVATVTVDMGRPRLLRHEIPMTGPANERALGVPLQVGDRELTISCVSMGNPHAISFVTETGDALRALAASVGPAVETHATFPNRTNAEFARIASPTEIELVVWERGCGITLACGTGACATAVAACLAGHCQAGQEIAVHLPGGPLHITVDANYERVLMRGPAHHVYDATVDLAAVAARGR